MVPGMFEYPRRVSGPPLTMTASWRTSTRPEGETAWVANKRRLASAYGAVELVHASEPFAGRSSWRGRAWLRRSKLVLRTL